MTAETCCRDKSDELKPWVFSRRAKESIHDFSVNILRVAEEIRVDLKYPNDPDRHFFPYSMRYWGYFVKEADPSFVESNKVEESPLVVDTNRITFIGAIGFHHYPVDSQYSVPKGFVKSDKTQQEKIVLRFLDKLGFIPKAELEGEPSSIGPDYEYYHFFHPDIPILAHFGRAKNSGTLSHVRFYYYEINEHQLSFDLPETQKTPSVIY